jgi:hypothetical protein
MSFCKPSTCNFTYPILETECLGNSLSAINYNFRAVDSELCTTETEILNNWNPAYTYYTELSAKITSMLTTVATYSACWQNTYSTVGQMSAFWLTPISVMYPFPIAIGANTNSTTITTWVNGNFPAKSGNCFNYIVGQEIYVYVPEYTSVRRTKTETSSRATYTETVIASVPPEYYKWFYAVGNYDFNVVNFTCPGYSVTMTANLDDTYIEKFVGLRLTLGSDFVWGNAVTLF